MSCANFEVHEKPRCSMFDREVTCEGNGWKCDFLGGIITNDSLTAIDKHNKISVKLKPNNAEWIWIKPENHYYQYQGCSKCKYSQGFKTNYCPNCGSRMINGNRKESLPNNDSYRRY